MLGSLGVLGLLRAAIGLYGVMLHSVGRMVLAGAAKLILTGLSVGLLCAFFLVKPLALFVVPGLHPNDPISFLAVVLLLSVAGFAAAWSPARHAAAVDPMVSLLHE